MDEKLEQLSKIDTSKRILLLPHCLRLSHVCKATYNQEGLQCAQCDSSCSVNLLRTAALEKGYKGVCVAPGGRLALKYVANYRPEAIVAVACDKELEEGVQGVKELSKMDITPLTVIIPLSKDGCVNTELDVKTALEIIATGCEELSGQKSG